MSPDSADQHSYDTAPTVTVRGNASIRVEPDEALLSVNLSALERAPGPALADVSARSHGLTALLDELRVAKADRSTTGVTVYEAWDYIEGERRFLGHRASARVSVRLTDPEVLGRLIAQATQNLAAKIDGPNWRVNADNPVWLEAAKQAAADGRRKAGAYAEGAGAKLGQLIRLIEPEIGYDRGWRRASSAALAAEAPSESMQIERGEHEVAASINVTFALEVG